MNNIEEIKSDLKPFIGTKKIKACPMTWGQYCELRGIPVTQDANPGLTPHTFGYLVEYPDTEHLNDPRFDGYISWSPLKVFVKSYQPAETERDFIRIEIRRIENEMYRLQDRINKEKNTLDHRLMKIQINALQTCVSILYNRLIENGTEHAD